MWVEEGDRNEEYDTAKVDYISSFGFPNVFAEGKRFEYFRRSGYIVLEVDRRKFSLQVGFQRGENMFSLRKTKQILTGNNLYMKFFISICQFVANLT